MFLKKKMRDIDQSKIESAVADFENSVDCELMPVLADKSSYVEHISWVLSLLLLILQIGVIEWLFTSHWTDSWMSRWPFYLATPFVSFGLAILLDKSDRIDRFFISRSERARQVQQKAELFFYRQRLHELKSKNAVMLYVSVMERQIVLRHDERMDFEGLDQLEQEVLRILQTSFKQADFEGGFLKAIAHLKTAMAPRFTKNVQTSNNVPNKLIWLKD